MGVNAHSMQVMKASFFGEDDFEEEHKGIGSDYFTIFIHSYFLVFKKIIIFIKIVVASPLMWSCKSTESFKISLNLLLNPYEYFNTFLFFIFIFFSDQLSSFAGSLMKEKSIPSLFSPALKSKYMSPLKLSQSPVPREMQQSGNQQYGVLNNV